MKFSIVLVLLVASPSFILGQTSASPSEACGKNISFAVAEGGQPVPAIPKFTSKWIDKKLHEQGYRGLCFSQIPSSSMSNYVVIFSTSESMFEGLTASAHTYTSATPGSGNGTVISSYGGTWSYSYMGLAPRRTTTTLDLRRDDKPKSLYVRAYNQQGQVISRNGLGGFPSREKLLEYVLANILGDAPLPLKQQPFAAPLSVYYVNCDVDHPTQTAMGSPPDPPRAGPPRKDPVSQAVLDFWSSPLGADIYLDGGFIGQTPYSLIVSPGEHTITMRKKDFGTWQSKLQVAAGKRRVAAYMEQKTLTLQ